MSKKGKNSSSQDGKVKELIFDANSGKLLEVDEKGNASDKEVSLKEELSLDYTREFDYDILFGTDDKKERSIIDPIEEEKSVFPAISIDKEKVDKIVDKTKDISTKTIGALAVFGQAVAKWIVSVYENIKDLVLNLINTAKGEKTDVKKSASNSKSSISRQSASNTKTAGEKENAKKKISTVNNSPIDKKHLIILATFVGIIAIFSSTAYLINYFRLPKLDETHLSAGTRSYKDFNAEVHPMKILSTTLTHMKEYKGEPNEAGAGKTIDTRYVIYSLDWFGKRRKSILFYNSYKEFYRIKLDIGNDSAQFLYDNLIENLGQPIEDNNPLQKGGYAIWLKDAIKYKLIHRGNFSTIDINIATYENKSKLAVGENPIVIQDIRGQDLNKDNNPNERILLIGNRESNVSTNFKKLYLLIWDGEKTHLVEMPEEYDGGNYPQLNISDYNQNGVVDFVISTENSVLDNYNVFEFVDNKLTNIYSGHEQ